MNHLHFLLASAFFPFSQPNLPPPSPHPHPSSSSGAPPLEPPTVVVFFGVDRRPSRQQQLHQLAMAVLRSQVQRRFASGSLRISRPVGAVGWEERKQTVDWGGMVWRCEKVNSQEFSTVVRKNWTNGGGNK